MPTDAEQRAAAKAFRMMARGCADQANKIDPDGREHLLVEASTMTEGQLAAAKIKVQALITQQNATIDEQQKQIAALNAQVANLNQQLAAAQASPKLSDRDEDAALWFDKLAMANEGGPSADEPAKQTPDTDDSIVLDLPVKQ